MKEFLLFTIQAPLASWGDIAVGEWRGSWDTPSRSAVIGLLGGALGIDRADADGQAALRDGYRVAVRADRKGSVLHDYHTMQSLPQSIVKKHNLRTRASLWRIDKKERLTVLSRRAYRQNVVHTVAVWAAVDARWLLRALAEALRHPVFAPYAGRRSNPLGLPMFPEVLSAETLASAFVQRSVIKDSCGAPVDRLQPKSGWGHEVAHDTLDEAEAGFDTSGARIIRRRDVPLRRDGWLFSERAVVISQLPTPEDGA